MGSEQILVQVDQREFRVPVGTPLGDVAAMVPEAKGGGGGSGE